MAKLDASRLETGGAAPVAVGNQFKPYLGTPAAQAPSAPASAAPSASPTSFVGPIPSTATRTSTGYTTSSGTTVTPAPKPAPTPAISNQFSNVSNNASSTATTFSPATNISGKTDTTSSSINKKALAGDAAELAFGAKSFPAGARALGAAITGKNAQGKSVNRLSSAAAGIGNIGLGAINAASTASLLIPGGGEVAKAADVALNVALKSGKLVGTKAAGKAAIPAAAAMLAASPAGHAYQIAKPVTAITQSVEAGKAAKAVGTFVPKAAKSSTTSSLAKSVPDVVKPSVASGVKAGTGIKVAKTITAVDAAAKVGTALNNKDAKDTKDKTPTVTKSAVDYQTPSKTNDSRYNQFKAEAENAGSKEGTTTFKGTDAKEFKDNIYKKDTKDKTDSTVKHKNIAPDEAAYNAKDIINQVKPFQAVAESGGKGTEGPRPPKAPEKAPTKKPRRIPRFKLQNQGGQWRPSSIV